MHEDSADVAVTINSIKKGVEFKGANLWTLIFAIFIASIGLNVNSTAVIIGAMLISPLMGPIMGVGLGIGINDIELVKKGLRNLAIATVISIAASSLYFWITPLHEVSSELLSRTSPSIWDVFIAGLGGLAGIVAATRTEKSNAIPGVAIATALMPPLCTAGFGIASGNLYFFLGAIYLYFINSIFICVATYLIVRFLKFPKKQFEDHAYEKRVRRYILIIVLVTAAPSVVLAFRLVDQSIFENNAQAFIDKEMNYRETQVITKNFRYSSSRGNEIDLLLLGETLDSLQLDSLNKKLSDYKLAKTKLRIRQGLNAKNKIDLSQIKASILEAVYQTESLKNPVIGYSRLNKPFPDVSTEVKSLYPQISAYSITNVVRTRLDTNLKDTLTLFVASFTQRFPSKDNEQLSRWLETRLEVDSVRIIEDR